MEILIFMFESPVSDDKDIFCPESIQENECIYF